MATYPSTADGHGHGVPVAVPLSVLDATQWRAPVPLLSAPVASVPIEIDGVNTDLLDIDTNADADADTAADPASENPSTEAYASGQDLDAVLPWTDACFFLTLFLRDQHCLVPVVHKPSFAQSLLARADKTDDALRGLVCSIIAFTICQCPISSMIGAGYARPRLVSILGRCRRAAEAVRTRQRMSRRPSLVLLSSALLDWITAQAVGDPQSTELHIAETTRLAHALGLHAAGAGPSGSGSGVDTETDTVERELRHRLYWIIYSKDKTDALSGRPLILHDFEGLPPLPLQVDDDYITPAGHLPQPTGRTSYMVGVVAIARIFRVISQCVVRHRAFANANVSPGGEGGDEGDDDDRADREAEVELHLAWTRVAQQRLHAILAGLPATLRTNLAEMAEMAAPESPGGGGGRLFGIQQANITITALCAEFALLDLRAALRPDEDTRAEREEVARNAYATLSSIPYEYLASNGESMVRIPREQGVS
jgi:hypothetical protein